MFVTRWIYHLCDCSRHTIFTLKSAFLEIIKVMLFYWSICGLIVRLFNLKGLAVICQWFLIAIFLLLINSIAINVGFFSSVHTHSVIPLTKGYCSRGLAEKNVAIKFLIEFMRILHLLSPTRMWKASVSEGQHLLVSGCFSLFYYLLYDNQTMIQNKSTFDAWRILHFSIQWKLVTIWCWNTM